MKRNISRTLLIVFVATFFVSMAATAQAKVKDPQCTLARAAGDWGFTTTGAIILSTGAAVPVAAVGTFTLDAAGNLAGSQTRSTGIPGVKPASETFKGTAPVQADCTGKATIDTFDESGTKVRTSTLDFVDLSNETEARAIYTSVTNIQADGTRVPLQVVLTIDYKKLFPQTDNQDEQ